MSVSYRTHAMLGGIYDKSAIEKEILTRGCNHAELDTAFCSQCGAPMWNKRTCDRDDLDYVYKQNSLGYTTRYEGASTVIIGMLIASISDEQHKIVEQPEITANMQKQVIKFMQTHDIEPPEELKIYLTMTVG